MSVPARAFALGLLASAAGLLAGCDRQGDGGQPAPTPVANAAPAAPQPSSLQAGKAVPQGSGFDFYVLSLSWSPSYCEAEGEDANRQQCKAKRPYAFVVHGLWPQFERGFPQDCGGGDEDVDRQTLGSLYDLMPSAGLIRHEWRTHGTCSGLAQADYFDVLRQARERIVIPTEYRRLDSYVTLKPQDAEQAFVRQNPGLRSAGVAVACDKRYLREVRICMTKDLSFRDCPEIDRRACTAETVVMPPVRGG